MGNRTRARIPSAAKNEGEHALISSAKARQLYELALRFSMLSERAGAGSWLRGREGVLAGLMGNLDDGDTVVAEDVSLVNEVLWAYRPVAGRPPVGVRGADPMVESVYSATLARLHKNGRVTVIVLPIPNGDTLLREVRTVAISASLPLLFVQDERVKAEVGKGNGMPAVPVDADDVVALYRVAHESIARARSGGGPTEIACVQWRTPWNRHSTQAGGEVAIKRLEQWLLGCGLPVAVWREEIAERLEAIRTTNGEDGLGGIDAQPFARADIQFN